MTNQKDSVLHQIIKEDVSTLSSSKTLWEISKDKPEIKQIYGHFLPPLHKKMVKGLVAIDFNFPASYHSIDKEDSKYLNKYYNDRFQLSPHEKFHINKSVRIRPDPNGAIVYTSYFNGFFINEIGYRIIKRLSDNISIAKIYEELNCDKKSFMEFVSRLLALGILHVHT